MSLIKIWSKDQRTKGGEPLWEAGNLLVEGDSNIHNTNVKKRIHREAFNVGRGGDIPQMCIDQMPAVRKRHEQFPIKKVYICVGGNLWIWYPLDIFNLNLGVYLDSMRKLIHLYKALKDISAQDIVIATLPYVHPVLTLGDMVGDKYLPESIEKHVDKIKLVDIFALASEQLKNICREEGVQCLDIYNILKILWKSYVKENCLVFKQPLWWDYVHFAHGCQSVIGAEVRRMWGVKEDLMK